MSAPAQLNDPIPLILIPGLAADARMFAPQAAAFPRLIIPPWLPPAPREPLAAYARRMAATIQLDEPFALGGVSFGGMLALEMSLHLRPRAVFLISSCRSYRQIPRWMRLAERLSRPFPDALADLARRFAPLLRSRSPRKTAAQSQLFRTMLAETPTPFLRWSARAICDWTLSAAPSAPVFHIHGDRDWVIPAARQQIDLLIPGAGHIAFMTHAEEVNAFIAHHMWRPPSRGPKYSRVVAAPFPPIAPGSPGGCVPPRGGISPWTSPRLVDTHKRVDDPPGRHS